jgi:hypothetical protein
MIRSHHDEASVVSKVIDAIWMGTWNRGIGEIMTIYFSENRCQGTISLIVRGGNLANDRLEFGEIVA